MSVNISIIMPTFNRADFIVESVNSIVNQSYKDWELIIIDDGSTDNTKTVLAGLLDDPRISYIKQENSGQSCARNSGIKAAKSKWLCFLDSDNLWPEDKLSVSWKYVEENPKAEIIYGEITRIDENGRCLGPASMKRYSGRITSKLLNDNFITINTVTMKKDCINALGGFNETDRLAEDYELWLRLSTRYSFNYVEHMLAYYRVMENQLSSDKEKRFEANLNILISFRKSFPESVSMLEWRKGMSFFYTRRARYLLGQYQYCASMTDLIMALYQYPLWSGPWKVGAKSIVNFISEVK